MPAWTITTFAVAWVLLSISLITLALYLGLICWRFEWPVLSFNRAFWAKSLRDELPLLGIAVLVAMEPIRTTLGYGQVNTVLMALVIADLLPDAPGERRRIPQGTLIGLAAAIKLTPALFVIFAFLIGKTRERVYRLQVNLLGRYQAVIYVGRAGEILRVELPSEITLLNYSLTSF